MTSDGVPERPRDDEPREDASQPPPAQALQAREVLPALILFLIGLACLIAFNR